MKPGASFLRDRLLRTRRLRGGTRVGQVDRNRVREFVTIHRGTEGGGRLTAIGDDNLLMAYVHVAHDVRVGSRTILANGVTFAGHVADTDGLLAGSSILLAPAPAR